MKGARLYTLTSSLHPWLYEAAKGNPDQQVKHALDRLLREIESDVEWYVSSNMEEQLRLLDKLTGLDSLTYLNTYEGGSLATTGVSKIRIIGKKVELWNTTTPNFPSTFINNSTNFPRTFLANERNCLSSILLLLFPLNCVHSGCFTNSTSCSLHDFLLVLITDSTSNSATASIRNLDSGEYELFDSDSPSSCS